MTGLRILHCLRAPVGGLFRHVRDLAAAQSERGNLVGAIVDSSAADALTAARLDALAGHLALGLYRIPMSRDIGWRDLTAVRSTTRIGRELKIDIIHGHGAKGGAYGRLAAQRLAAAMHEVQSFYTPHGGSLHYAPTSLKGRVYMALERHLLAGTSGLIFESQYSSRLFGAHVGFGTVATRVIPNGLLAEEFTVHRPAADASDVLFIGELRYLKGVDILLDAIAQLQNQRPTTATIVGDGPDAAHFKRQAQSLGLRDRVRFLGAMPAREAFPLGRVLAMPSRAESFPYIVLEAAAAGIPLIATAVGGIPEIVTGTDTGLVAPDNADALSNALSAALKDQNASDAKAGRLKGSVAARFTVERMTTAVLDFYKSRLDQSNRSG